MEDRLVISDHYPESVSPLLRQFIEALVEEVVVEGKPFDDQKKKYLQRYSQEEGVDYATLEKNLTEFFETLEELKSLESKALERFAEMLGMNCYLEESVVNRLVSVMKEVREREKEEVKRIAKDKKEKERIAKEKAERKAAEDARIKAEEEVAYKRCTTVEGCDSYLNAYHRGRYVKQVQAKKAELEEQSRPKDVSGTANGHEYVDLGLPSGTLWATCNVGANKPEEYGDYFAWGETCPNCEYNEDTNKYYEDFEPIKYTDKDHLKVLQLEDDAARANWGTGWRMPTKEEWEELRDNVTHKWAEQNGVDGRLFTANNGNSLFLPAAGVRCDEEFFNIGNCGHYRSSSLYTDDPSLTWNFDCCSVNCDVYDGIRTDGQSVRPVRSVR